MRRLLPLLLLTGCATTQTDSLSNEQLRKLLRDPKGLLPAFQALIRVGEYTRAHNYCLATDPRTGRKILDEKEFQLGLSSLEVVPRLLLSLEEHGIDKTKGTIRLCSAEFGVSKEFRIQSEFGGRLWTLDFRSADIDYFKKQALAWFRRQTESAGHRFHAYPPGWKYAGLLPHCGCNRNG